MSQFRYQMVTGDAESLVETLNSLGQAGWRLVAATPTGGAWSALLEQEVESLSRRAAGPRARVEVRVSGEVVEKFVEADALSVLDGVVYLRRDDEVLATHPMGDLVAVDWSPAPSSAQTLDRKRRDHPRHGEPWSPEEDDQLRQEHEAHWTLREMIAGHQRGRGAIAARLAKLGLDGPGMPGWSGQETRPRRGHDLPRGPLTEGSDDA